MKLKDFPFRTTASLPTFSDLLTSAVTNCTSLKKSQKKKVDEIECWYYTCSEACIGRYLSYKKTPKRPKIEFWLGIEIKANEVRLIIWFNQGKNRRHWLRLKRTIRKNFLESENCENEIWIPLPAGDFENFCKKNYQVVSNFIDKVLSII